ATAGRGFAGTECEKFFGLGFENDGNDGQSACVGFEAEFLEDVFVSEVHAVEIAYGYGGPVRKVGRVVPPRPDFHCISFSVETPPLGHPSFGAAGSDFIREGCNPFQIRTVHMAVLYVSYCVLKH
ncbi:hypothetical protein NGI46_29595, partial [Peribacillus butanolivorans]|nr:hypothetical protein [Peribacillus butanolivorans]